MVWAWSECLPKAYVLEAWSPVSRGGVSRGKTDWKVIRSWDITLERIHVVLTGPG